MKRALASLVMAVGLLFATMVPAQASHSRTCTEVWIHFRPAYFNDQHDGMTWVWVCPDGYWNHCYLVVGPLR